MLEGDDVGELVAKGFLEDVPLFEETFGKTDESARRIASAKAAGHAGAELNGDLGVELRSFQQGEPIRRTLDGPFG